MELWKRVKHLLKRKRQLDFNKIDLAKELDGVAQVYEAGKQSLKIQTKGGN